MYSSNGLTPSDREETPFERLIRRLGETFLVRDIMVPLGQMESVKPGDSERAAKLMQKKRYSVVPTTRNEKTFNSVFTPGQKTGGNLAHESDTKLSDHIPDSTPLAEAFSMFDNREWYLTLRSNHVSGLITYWAFNNREFRVQLYAGLSRVEELSRSVLVKDEIGILDKNGLCLSPKEDERIQKRIKSEWKENGGNRFIDELDYRQVHRALSKHQPWRTFLNKCIPGIGNSEYGQRFNFTDIRNAVMHGRTIFPTYVEFKKRSAKVREIRKFIKYLDSYMDGEPDRIT
jgi:hypothetical protein